LRTLTRIDRARDKTHLRGKTAMASADNLPAANEKTYGGFITLLKWAVPTVAIIGLIVILLIS